MPDFTLIFGDREYFKDEPATQLPEPAAVGHAAAWAAERGYWDVATCLMELAHALANLETPTPAHDPRYVRELGIHDPTSNLTRALERNRGLSAPLCPGGPGHGQPLLKGMRLDNGDFDWKCVCTPHGTVPSGALDGHHCEHGYWTAHNRHIATSGVCDLSAGDGN